MFFISVYNGQLQISIGWFEAVSITLNTEKWYNRREQPVTRGWI